MVNFSVRMSLKFNGWPHKKIGHLFYAMSSFVHYFKAIGEFKLELQSGNAQFGSKSAFSCPVWTFHRWPWKTIGHYFFATSSFGNNFIAIGQFTLELQFGNAQFGSNRRFFVPCDLEIRQMTLKNKRAFLLCYFKLSASFHSYLWIQTWATVQKRPIWVKIGNFLSRVTLKFDEWPWKPWECPNWGKICFELSDLDLWLLTLTFCMDITFVNGNNSWTFHDDLMTRT